MYAKWYHRSPLEPKTENPPQFTDSKDSLSPCLQLLFSLPPFRKKLRAIKDSSHPIQELKQIEKGGNQPQSLPTFRKSLHNNADCSESQKSCDPREVMRRLFINVFPEELKAIFAQRVIHAWKCCSPQCGQLICKPFENVYISDLMPTLTEKGERVIELERSLERCFEGTEVTCSSCSDPTPIKSERAIFGKDELILLTVPNDCIISGDLSHSQQIGEINYEFMAAIQQLPSTQQYVCWKKNSYTTRDRHYTSGWTRINGAEFELFDNFPSDYRGLVMIALIGRNIAHKGIPSLWMTKPENPKFDNQKKFANMKFDNMKKKYIFPEKILVDEDFEQQWLLEENILGSGAYGTVYTLPRTEPSLVVKLFDEATPDLQRIIDNEIQILKTMKNTGIVGYAGYLTKDLTDEEHIVGIAMKEVYGLSLGDYIFSPKTTYSMYMVLLWMEKLFDTLEFLQVQGIFHRDVKPDNILIPANGWPVLADFGLSKSTSSNIGVCLSASSGEFGSFVGTRRYMCPEIILYRPGGENFEFTHASDLYSMGIIFWEMIERRPLFAKYIKKGVFNSDDFESDLYEKKNLKELEDLECLTKFQEIIYSCCAFEPTERMCAAAASERCYQIREEYDRKLLSDDYNFVIGIPYENNDFHPDDSSKIHLKPWGFNGLTEEVPVKVLEDSNDFNELLDFTTSYALSEGKSSDDLLDLKTSRDSDNESKKEKATSQQPNLLPNKDSEVFTNLLQTVFKALEDSNDLDDLLDLKTLIDPNNESKKEKATSQQNLLPNKDSEIFVNFAKTGHMKKFYRNLIAQEKTIYQLAFSLFIANRLIEHQKEVEIFHCPKSLKNDRLMVECKYQKAGEQSAKFLKKKTSELSMTWVCLFRLMTKWNKFYKYPGYIRKIEKTLDMIEYKMRSQKTLTFKCFKTKAQDAWLLLGTIFGNDSIYFITDDFSRWKELTGEWKSSDFLKPDQKELGENEEMRFSHFAEIHLEKLKETLQNLQQKTHEAIKQKTKYFSETHGQGLPVKGYVFQLSHQPEQCRCERKCPLRECQLTFFERGLIKPYYRLCIPDFEMYTKWLSAYFELCDLFVKLENMTTFFDYIRVVAHVVFMKRLVPWYEYEHYFLFFTLKNECQLIILDLLEYFGSDPPPKKFRAPCIDSELNLFEKELTPEEIDLDNLHRIDLENLISSDLLTKVFNKFSSNYSKRSEVCEFLAMLGISRQELDSIWDSILDFSIDFFDDEDDFHISYDIEMGATDRPKFEFKAKFARELFNLLKNKSNNQQNNEGPAILKEL